MIFSSMTFLGIFLPAVLLLYAASKNIKYRNTVLLAASLVFYAWGEPTFFMLLIASTAVNYALVLMMDKSSGTPKARMWLWCAVIFDILMVLIFKYTSMAVQSINSIFKTALPIPELGLPLGISFYTFQTLTYVIDVYRGDAKAQKSYLKFLTYVSMFPQLISGPIVKYSLIEKSLSERTVTLDGFASGASQFIMGLSKKVFLADFAGEAKDLLFAASTHPSVGSAWLGIIFYTLQLYFDFAGYSDMAIGVGKMLGFNFPKNFDYPYISRSVTEFWRRWHITLGGFFRDYVYIPLGGNRVGKYRHIINIMIVWMLTGLWHGASWNFVLWGLYYGILLIVEKNFFKNLHKIPVLSNVITMLAVVIGWGLFYFTDFSELSAFLGHLVGIGCNLYDLTTVSTFCRYWILLAVMIVASTPLPHMLYTKIASIKRAGPFLEALILILMFVGCFAIMTGATSSPFLYFKF